MSTNIGQAAAELAAHGWRVHPLRARDKRPRLDAWQHEATTDEETIASWWGKWPGANVGVVMGESSGIIDLECDSEDAEKLLLDLFDGHEAYTPTFQSARGKHRLFKYSASLPFLDKAHFKLGEIDVKIGGGGLGTYCLFPPSVHPSGLQYRWLISPDDCETAELPEQVIARIVTMLAEGGFTSPTGSPARPPEYWQKLQGGVGEGNRNQAAASVIGKLLHLCVNPLDPEEVAVAYSTAGAWNQNNKPPLPEKELRRTFDSILKKHLRSRDVGQATVAKSLEGPTEFHFTDTGNAERLVKRHGENMQFCHPWKDWLLFNGQRWERDQTGQPRQHAIDTCRAMLTEARDVGDREKRERLIKHAMASENEKRITAMLKQAQSYLPIRPETMDADHWLLNCPNGTLDLRTGELRAHRREDLITKLCPTAYDPTAAAPTFDRFMNAIFAGDREMIAFVLRLLGYALTGSTKEHVFTILWGNGSNGKSTLVETVMGVVGHDYAMKADKSLIAAKKYDGHPTERMDLFGKRLVVCSETEGGLKLNESFVKTLVGDGRIRGRRMREDSWEFDPTHKLLLCTNHKPTISDAGHGMWRRIQLVPFAVKFWDPSKGESGPPELQQDKELTGKLAGEASGILAALVRGCMEWQRVGLRSPQAAQRATRQYQADSDTVASFVERCCVLGEDCSAKSSDLFKAFKEWARDETDDDLTQRWFGQRMGELGFSKRKSNGWRYQGVRLVL